MNIFIKWRKRLSASKLKDRIRDIVIEIENETLIQFEINDYMDLCDLRLLNYYDEFVVKDKFTNNSFSILTSKDGIKLNYHGAMESLEPEIIKNEDIYGWIE